MRLLCICLLLVLQAAPTSAAPTPPVAVPEQREAVLTLIRARMAALQIPGLQIAVVRDGRIVLNEALGAANLEHGVPVTPTMRFSINSATKSFTGVAALQLVEAGKLDLDAPIGRYLGDLPAAWAAIPVHHLLSHQSGLPDIVEESGDPIGGSGEAEAWAAVRARPIEAAPGARFAYNQTNYALLARIIAAQSGMAFPDFVAQRQFVPAGMARAIFADSDDIVPGRAQNYSFYRQLRGQGNIKGTVLGHWADRFPPFLRAGAGIMTTATDMANWLLALEKGALLKQPASRARLWQADRLNDGTPGEWALGWPVIRAAPRRIVGGIGGARAAFFVYPDDGLAIIVLTNLAAANPQRFVDEIAQIYLGRP